MKEAITFTQAEVSDIVMSRTGKTTRPITCDFLMKSKGEQRIDMIGHVAGIGDIRSMADRRASNNPRSIGDQETFRKQVHLNR